MSLLRFLEACYQGETLLDSWTERLSVAAADLLPSVHAAGAFAYAYESGGTLESRSIAASENVAEHVLGGCSDERGWLAQLNTTPLGRRITAALFGAADPLVWDSARAPQPELPSKEWFPDPALNGIAMYSGLREGIGVQVGLFASPGRPLPRRQMETLLELAEHLGAAHALRRMSAEKREAQTAAVISAERVVDSEELAGADAARLVDAVRAMDRARLRRRQVPDEEAASLWQAFVGGQYSLLETYDRAGTRRILAIRIRSDARALSPRERAVVRHVVSGASNKQVAAVLGVSEASVAKHLRAAIRKLGCASRSELVARSSTPYWGG